LRAAIDHTTCSHRCRLFVTWPQALNRRCGDGAVTAVF